MEIASEVVNGFYPNGRKREKVMFNEMFKDVKKFLTDRDVEATAIAHLPFRKRSEHTWRVFHWAKRLMDEGNFDITVDKESVLIAALFHDVGYAYNTGDICDPNHAEKGAIIFNQYASEKNLDVKKQEFISYLIRNHSEISLFDLESTPLELIILIEADLLDETGALGIVWDCMSEGGQMEQSFIKTYRHIEAYSYKTFESNPMKTDKAKEFWTNKQNLMREFFKQLACDLALDER